jgi:hypothetical protein
MQPSTPKQVLDWLSAEPAYRNAAAQIDTLVRIEAALRRAAPELALAVVAIQGETLIAATRSAAAAAKCRQLEPSLLAAVQETTAKVNRIRFRPQRSSRKTLPPVAPRQAIPEGALAAFAELGAATGAGRRSATSLQRALTRLVKRQRLARSR